jgi:tetratricopeptide (TPR) repeat protein
MNRKSGRPGGAAPGRAQRRLARLTVTIPLVPGGTPSTVSVASAINLGRRALADGDFHSAIFLGEQLRRAPGATLAGLVLLTQATLGLGRPGDALELSRQLLDIGVEDADDVLVCARGLHLCNRHAQAIELLGNALERAPMHTGLRLARGEMLGEIGERDAAVAELRRVIRLDPRCYAAYRSLAMLDTLGDEDVQALERAPAGSAGRAQAAAGLAFAWRQRGDVDREFRCLDEAHALLAPRDPWFPHEETEMADQVIAELDEAWFRAHPPVGASGERRPIFILGMPRSGSTLTEQILVSADGVEATGESLLFPWLLLDLASRRYGEPPYPEIAHKLQPDDLLALRRDYLRLVERVYTASPVFVDKQFTNWKYVGLLRLILPEARFVHTVRDPLDTCLSAYQQVFGTLGYGHNLEHLALILKDQQRVMAHWKALFPGEIHTLEYEKLIADPEAEIRALLAFCGIPWTDRALRFHETRRGIKTASVMQVRQPIYTSSVHKWKRYDKYLGPARRVLEGR